MILKRFYDDKLAQASYLVGCPGAGEACVIDANRDVAQYLEAAASEGLRITSVTETHIHADYVSGSRELAEITGAQLYLSDEGTADWKYGFAGQPNVTLVKDGHQIRVGGVRLDVLKTPGHTPEHIAFILTDEPASSEPLAAFTGDFIFVGDVGRPDLLERAAGFEGTMEAGAKVLFGSIQRFLGQYGDSLLIWPAHGAGSACGKALGGSPVSSLGYEKLSNWGLKFKSEQPFVESVLAGQPEPPFYFKEMKRINRDGPPLLGGFHIPSRLAGTKIFDLLAEEVTIFDIRDDGEAASGFIPGIVNVPENRGFTNWAGWFAPYDRPIYLLADSESQVREAIRDLAMIGLDHVRGWFGEDALRAYEERMGELASTPQATLSETLERVARSEITLVDVRGVNEWNEGAIPGAVHIPLGYLPAAAGNLDLSKPVVVHCRAGGRSPIAATILRKLGFERVENLPGGYAEYEREGDAHRETIPA